MTNTSAVEVRTQELANESDGRFVRKSRKCPHVSWAVRDDGAVRKRREEVRTGRVDEVACSGVEDVASGVGRGENAVSDVDHCVRRGWQAKGSEGAVDGKTKRERR